MLTTSAAFKNAIASEDREIRAYLKFNGSTILRGVDGLVSIEWDQSVYDEERLCIGCAVSSFITAEFFDNLTGVDFKNSYVEAFVGVVLEDTGTAPSGSIEPDTATVEYVSLGRFDITDSVTKNGKTVITAYDKLSKLSGEYTPSISAGTNGYAIADIVNDVLTQSGVGGSVSGSYGYVQKIQASTYREQLKYCLTMMVQNGSSYILDRTNDTLKMTSVIGQDATQLTITDSTTYMGGMDEQPSFTISSLQATTGTDVYTFGNGQGIEISNPYITNAQASAIYNSMEGFSYLPIRLEFRGNPAIDPGDVLTLTAGGKNTKIVAMRIRSTFNGGFKSTIDCYGNTETYYAMSESPTGTRITQAENMIRLEAARATAAEGSLSSLIDINAEGISLVSEKLNNIGGRNYLWAMDKAIHKGAYYQNCSVTYNPDNNGEYVITGGSIAESWQQAMYYANGLTGYPVPDEIKGKTVIFHIDEIISTSTEAECVLWVGNENHAPIFSQWLTASNRTLTFTMPAEAVYMTPAFRIRETTPVVSGETATFRGAKLELGQVPTDWTPAPEDGQAQVTSVRNEVTVNTEGITLLSQKVDNIGGRNYLRYSNDRSTWDVYSPEAYLIARIGLYANMIGGKKYTVTIWGTAPTASGVEAPWYSIYWGGGNTSLGKIYISGGKGSLSFTAPTSGGGVENAWIEIYNTAPNPSSSSFTANITAVKLEEGEVSTDWSAAPEDKTGNNEIIAKINLSPENITISANKVDLQGYVTFTNLSTSGQTAINGGNITTNTISADKLNITDLNAIGATIGGFKIETNSIHTNGVAITSNATNSVGLSSSTFTRTINGTSRDNLKLAIGSNFGVANDGTLYASNGNFTGTITSNNATITGGTLNISGTVTFNASDYTASDLTRIRDYILNGNTLPTMEDYTKYDIDRTGTFTISDVIKVRDMVNGEVSSYTATSYIDIDPAQSNSTIHIWSSGTGSSGGTYIGAGLIQSTTVRTGNTWINSTDGLHVGANDVVTGLMRSSGVYYFYSDGTNKMTLDPDEGLSFSDSSGNTIASYPADGLIKTGTYTATNSQYGSLSISSLCGITANNGAVLQVYAYSSSYPNGITCMLTQLSNGQFWIFARRSDTNGMITSTEMTIVVHYIEKP